VDKGTWEPTHKGQRNAIGTVAVRLRTGTEVAIGMRSSGSGGDLAWLALAHAWEEFG
jgi:hypothetical protein